MKVALSHIAILVHNIESVLDKNLFDKEDLGKVEKFESEGTKEIYIGLEKFKNARILLMEPIENGPYQKAIESRGEGLHHIALDVSNLDEFLTNLEGSGWLLHPKSIWFYKKLKQVYLCRPGIKCLIEVQEKKEIINEDLFVNKISLPDLNKKLLNALQCSEVISGEVTELFLSNNSIKISDLI